jgi:hypothetical protein
VFHVLPVGTGRPQPPLSKKVLLTMKLWKIKKSIDFDFYHKKKPPLQQFWAESCASFHHGLNGDWEQHVLSLWVKNGDWDCIMYCHRGSNGDWHDCNCEQHVSNGN